jgi:hypothetical protein
VLAVCAGVGWMYLLRDDFALATGPSMKGALPLQELAGRGAQPLLRVAVAWLPSGLAAGIVLALSTRMRALAIGAACGLIAFLLVFASTAGSEAVEHNERLAAHLGAAFGRSGLWAALAFVVIGSLLGAALTARARRHPLRVPRPRRRASSSAA